MLKKLLKNLTNNDKFDYLKLKNEQIKFKTMYQYFSFPCISVLNLKNRQSLNFNYQQKYAFIIIILMSALTHAMQHLRLPLSPVAAMFLAS